MPLLERDDCFLLVIDAQQCFYPTTRDDVDFDRLHDTFDRSGWLVAVASAVGVPIVVTEEEADINGATDARIASHLPHGTPILDKKYFGAPANPQIMRAIDDTHRGTAVIVGMETDVCVSHTALLLKQQGHRVVVAQDCLFSPGDAHDAGLQRLRDAGVEMLSAKGVFYDWVRGVAELYAACAASDVIRRTPGFHL